MRYSIGKFYGAFLIYYVVYAENIHKEKLWVYSDGIAGCDCNYRRFICSFI